MTADDEKISKPLGFQINILSQMIKYRINRNLAEFGITVAQARLISYIGNQYERNLNVYQRDIEKIFNIKRSSVTSLLKSLEKNGLITRQEALDDLRAKHIMLTEKGHFIFKEIGKNLTETEKVISSSISDDEKEIFTKIVSKLIDNLKEVSK